jgi:hypothetical protein
LLDLRIILSAGKIFAEQGEGLSNTGRIVIDDNTALREFGPTRPAGMNV